MPDRPPAKLIPLNGLYASPNQNNMIHYLAIVEFPDGEHLLHGWSQSLYTARKHLDEHILNRRRANIPDEEVTLVSVRHIDPNKINEEVDKEEQRIRAKYPDRLHAGDQFATPNHILEQRITPDPNEETEEAPA
jgi:hypothetical protein